MKRIGFYTLSLAMLALLIFALVEISARILFRDSSYNVHPLSEFQHDPTLGWKGIPGYLGKSPLSKAKISINQYGFRDRDWAIEMSRSISLELPRLLFIGDSCIYGYEIESDERFTEQLEYLYKSKGRAISVFNAGIPAWGTSEEFRALEMLFPILFPDVVFCMYSSNDIGDSALPYCWGDPKFRVYRCFYDVDGNLILSQAVPQRFSLRIKGSLWEYLRLRFIIDRIESFIDDLRYSSLGISENRRIPVSNQSEDLIRLDRHMWDMGDVGHHPGFRDIYEKNKHRNFNLWKKMSDICRQHGKRFLVLTYFSGDPDPTHSNQEIITFLRDHDIEFLNVDANNGDYDHWGYVNYDGHPNFLANYLKAVTLYNFLEHSNTTADFPNTLWYENLCREINFEQEEFHKYLFGINWDKTREKYQNKTGKWLRGKAKVILRGSEQRKSSKILIEGMSPTANNSITAFVRGSNISSKAVIAKEGLFEITLDLGQTDPASLLLIDLDAGSPVFVFRIKSLDL